VGLYPGWLTRAWAYLGSTSLGLRLRRKPSQEESDEALAEKLRRRGVRVGKGCRIYTTHFSTEPWLVQIGTASASQGVSSF